MANTIIPPASIKLITDLPVANPLNGYEYIAISQSGVTKETKIVDVGSFIQTYDFATWVYNNSGNVIVLQGLSGIWDSVYATVSSLSSDWNSVYATFQSISTNDVSVYNTVYSLSSNWNSVYSQFNPISTALSSVYTSVLNTSANWNSVYATFQNISSNDLSVYATFQNISSNDLSVYSTVSSLSSNWNSVYSNVNSNSANNSSVYSNVNTNSSTITWVNNNSSNFVYNNLQNQTIYGNVIITGSLSAQGGTSSGTTNIGITSAFRVINTSPSVYSIYVSQASGSVGIASFNDGSIEVLHIGKATNSDGSVYTGGYVGINTPNPNKTLTVTGTISSTNDIFTSGLFQGNLSGNATTVTNGIYTNVNYQDPSWITSLNSTKLSGVSSTSWNSVYSQFNSISTALSSVYTSVLNTSGNWNSVFSTVCAASANWNSISFLQALSANDKSVYSNVNYNSGNWQTAYNNPIYTINGTSNQIVATPSGNNTANNSVTLSFPSSINITTLNVLSTLNVAGSANFYNTNNLNVSSNIIYFGEGNTSNALDLGIVTHFTGNLNNSVNNYQHTGLARKAGQNSPAIWTLFSGLTSEPNSTNSGINWNDPYLQVDTLSANLIGNATTVTNGIYTNVNYQDPSWITSLNSTKLSGVSSTSWNSVFSTVCASSANWNSISLLQSASANNASVFSTVCAASANWNSISFLQALSANDKSVYSLINTASSTTLNINNLSAVGNLSAVNLFLGTKTLTSISNNPVLTISGAASGSLFGQIQNIVSGVSASTDISLYNNDNINYLDLGIASTTYNGNLYSPVFNIVNAGDSYVYSTSSNLVLGASNSTGNVTFFTGGTLSGASGNERMRINSAGNVGIGTTTPNSLLTIAGAISTNNSYYGDGSKLTGIVTSSSSITSAVSANWQGAYTWVYNNSSNATFTNSVSAPSISANNIKSSGDIITTGNVYGGTRVVVLTAATSYTIQLSDNGVMIGGINSVNSTLSAFPSVSISYPIGFQTAFIQLSTGRITLSSSSIVINQASRYNKTAQQYSVATLMYVGQPIGWVLFGDLSN